MLVYWQVLRSNALIPKEMMLKWAGMDNPARAEILIFLDEKYNQEKEQRDKQGAGISKKAGSTTHHIKSR